MNTNQPYNMCCFNNGREHKHYGDCSNAHLPKIIYDLLARGNHSEILILLTEYGLDNLRKIPRCQDPECDKTTCVLEHGSNTSVLQFIVDHNNAKRPYMRCNKNHGFICSYERCRFYHEGQYTSLKKIINVCCKPECSNKKCVLLPYNSLYKQETEIIERNVPERCIERSRQKPEKKKKHYKSHSRSRSRSRSRSYKHSKKAKKHSDNPSPIQHNFDTNMMVHFMTGAFSSNQTLAMENAKLREENLQLKLQLSDVRCLLDEKFEVVYNN